MVASWARAVPAMSATFSRQRAVSNPAEKQKTNRAIRAPLTCCRSVSVPHPARLATNTGTPKPIAATRILTGTMAVIPVRFAVVPVEPAGSPIARAALANIAIGRFLASVSMRIVRTTARPVRLRGSADNREGCNAGSDANSPVTVLSTVDLDHKRRLSGRDVMHSARSRRRGVCRRTCYPSRYQKQPCGCESSESAFHSTRLHWLICTFPVFELYRRGAAASDKRQPSPSTSTISAPSQPPGCR